MINKIKPMVVICAAVLFMSACSSIAPLAISGNPIGKKVGTAKATRVLGIWFKGDYSAVTAAKNGGITKISTVDVRSLDIFMGIIVSTRKTIVTGE